MGEYCQREGYTATKWYPFPIILAVRVWCAASRLAGGQLFFQTSIKPQDVSYGFRQTGRGQAGVPQCAHGARGGMVSYV